MERPKAPANSIPKEYIDVQAKLACPSPNRSMTDNSAWSPRPGGDDRHLIIVTAGWYGSRSKMYDCAVPTTVGISIQSR